MNIDEKVEELERLIKPMDVPEFRRRNMRWLSRNLAIRNGNHKNYPKAAEIIKELLSIGVASR